MEVDLKQFGKYEVSREIELAIITGNLECIRKHMDAGWKVNQLLKLGESVEVTPVVLAIINNDYKTLDFLVENHANLDFRKCHAFLYAVRCCNKEMVRYVASLGASISARYSVGVGAYELACEYSDENRIEMFQLIGDLGLSAKDYAGQALIMQVNEDLEVLEYLLKQGVDANTKDRIFPGGQMTAMIYAIMRGNLEAVKLLVEYGADLTTATNVGTPYAVAMQQDQKEISDFILETINANNKVTRELREEDIYHLTHEIKELWESGKLIAFKRKEESTDRIFAGRKLSLSI